MVASSIFRTREAIEDLDGIWDYIARDNPTAADRILDALNERFVLLSKNPEMGELQPLLADGNYRRFTFRNYIIYYRPLNQGIVLVRVLNGAQDHESMLS
jgi:toxin ParE1/3/4